MTNFERHFGSVADAADFIVRMLTAESALPMCDYCPVRDACHADDDTDADCEDFIAAWLVQEVEE